MDIVIKANYEAFHHLTFIIHKSATNDYKKKLNIIIIIVEKIFMKRLNTKIIQILYIRKEKNLKRKSGAERHLPNITNLKK